MCHHINDPAVAALLIGKIARASELNVSFVLREVVIAECTCPSLGVGYELAYAEKIGKPCHIFYDRSKTQLSAMLTGNPYFSIHPYESENEIYNILESIL